MLLNLNEELLFMYGILILIFIVMDKGVGFWNIGLDGVVKDCVLCGVV